MQARFGERPSPAAWQRLAAIDESGAFLEAAGRAGLRRWVAGLDADMDLHSIEISLRERLRHLIRETAQWLPLPWREPMLWTSHLAQLPALAHVARGGEPHAWMREDPAIGVYLREQPPGPGVAVLTAAQRETLFASQPDAGAQPALHAALLAWHDMWVETWPPRSHGERASVVPVFETVVGHLQGLHKLASPERVPAVRAALEQQLRRLFRAGTLLPGAAFAYVALLALDLERVRAMLVECTLSPTRRSET
jgi:hypothetical protein